MARIPMTSGFVIIPEGEYVFRIYDATYDEDFGRIEIKLVNAQGATHTERFSIKDKNDEYNEKALNAFSYFAKTAMNDYTMEDIDPEQLINHYIRAEVVHTKVPSNKDPNKEVTFANLGDKSPADGFDTEPVARALTLGNGNNAAPKAAPNISEGCAANALTSILAPSTRHNLLTTKFKIKKALAPSKSPLKNGETLNSETPFLMSK